MMAGAGVSTDNGLPFAPGLGPDGLGRAPGSQLVRHDGRRVDWLTTERLVSYEEATRFMDDRVDRIIRGEARELVWLLEHPPLYTAGTSTLGDTAAPLLFPLYRTARGGQVTYHGPGQRVAYVMLDLSRRGSDIRRYLHALEDWLILTLRDLGIDGERRQDRVGIWVKNCAKPDGPNGEVAEDKIAAIGVRVRRRVTSHGFAINVDPDMTHFSSIRPCGICASHLGVTSLSSLGRSVSMNKLDRALFDNFRVVFDPDDVSRL